MAFSIMMGGAHLFKKLFVPMVIILIVPALFVQAYHQSNNYTVLIIGMIVSLFHMMFVSKIFWGKNKK
jgi:hypothetical protein